MTWQEATERVRSSLFAKSHKEYWEAGQRCFEANCSHPNTDGLSVLLRIGDTQNMVDGHDIPCPPATAALGFAVLRALGESNYWIELNAKHGKWGCALYQHEHQSISSLRAQQRCADPLEGVIRAAAEFVAVL